MSSISGGTDIVSCFVLGNLFEPVISGEIQNKGLGLDVDVFNENGKSIQNIKGELVCKSPFPSMPLKFWNDKHDVKYKDAYFNKFLNIWHHGDYIERKKSGGFIIYGRSDTTLNPGGVRIGTAEIYRAVENMNEIEDTIVVGKPDDGDVDIVLCVKLVEGATLDSEMQDNIRKIIRSKTTPRHVPKYIFSVTDIPYTISGKKVEKAVLATVIGKKIKNKDALANPDCLSQYSKLEF